MLLLYGISKDELKSFKIQSRTRDLIMEKKPAKKISHYVLLGTISLIILGFLFTGYQPGNQPPMSGNTTLATIGDQTITASEYQLGLANQIRMYSQFTGGKDLTEQQIEQFGIKQMVVNRLIDQKLMIELAENNDIVVSKDALGNEIKNLPYFKTNDKFDITKYKGLLRANGLTATEFEAQIRESLLARTVGSTLNLTPVTNSYAQDVFNLKNSGIEATIVSIEKDAIKKNLKITNAEIEEFYKKEDSNSKLESLYNRNLSKYKSPEQRKARHILIKTSEKVNEKQALDKANTIRKELTFGNFNAKANKYTEDESGKNKGGDLGWFSKGNMVKEFEQTAFSMKKGTISDPVKTQFGYHIILLEDAKDEKVTPLTSVKKALAEEILQDDQKRVEEKVTELKKEIEQNLAQKNFQAISKLSDTGVTLKKNIKIDGLNLKAENFDLTREDFDKLENQPFISLKKVQTDVYLAKTGNFSAKSIEDKETQITNEQKALESSYGPLFTQKTLEKLKEKYKVSYKQKLF
jgi:peptidyl-prolyl cis-trans isomerase D